MTLLIRPKLNITTLKRVKGWHHVIEDPAFVMLGCDMGTGSRPVCSLSHPLLDDGLEEQQRMAQVFGSLYHMGDWENTHGS